MHGRDNKMDATLFELKADYRKQSLAIAKMDEPDGKRCLLSLLRAVSVDHRFEVQTRLAYMSELLVAHRRLWCHA